MRKKKKNVSRKVRTGVPLATVYPFRLKSDCDYRLTFRNGQSAIYHGAALASNPCVPLGEVVQVAEGDTGEVIFALPREKQPEEKPGFYNTE